MVVNAEKIAVTGNKLADKQYHRFTGYIGNLKRPRPLRGRWSAIPSASARDRGQGMLPKNPLGRAMPQAQGVRRPEPSARRPAAGFKPAHSGYLNHGHHANYGTGRRKSSTARVFLRKGSGNITINERPLDEFFRPRTARMIVRQPLEPKSTDKFDVVVTAWRRHHRPGRRDPPRHRPRAGRVRRTLKTELRKAGFMTRDAREVERKKVGLHKARRATQFSKRYRIAFHGVGAAGHRLYCQYDARAELPRPLADGKSDTRLGSATFIEQARLDLIGCIAPVAKR